MHRGRWRRWRPPGTEIDGLNVYPVPDGDTGTNLLLTLQAADSAVRTDPPGDLAATLGSMARGAVLGARGNSGVILSQVLRGLAESMPAEPDGAGAGEGAGPGGGAGLDGGGRAGRGDDAVGGPRGGRGRRAAPADSLAAVARAAAGGAARALDRTPDQLPVLARAGVVDAGGRGLCVLLESLADGRRRRAGAAAEGPRRPRRAREMARETGSDAYGYEVQYLLDAADAGGLRAELAELGDSLVVVGTGEGTWTVHVHVNDIGAAIEAGVEAGRPHRITVTRFADEPPARREGTAVVAVAPGAGRGRAVRGRGGVLVAGGDRTSTARCWPRSGRPAPAPPSCCPAGPS